MTPLLAEIWMCLVVAAALGVVSGWLVWGRRVERVTSIYRARLAKIRRNWETVEERLAEAMARNAELEHALADRDRESVLRETAFHSILEESENAWTSERHLLESTLRGLEERIRSLETGQRAQTHPLDFHSEKRPS